MSDDIYVNSPTMLSCYLSSISINTGSVPEEDSDLDIKVEYATDTVKAKEQPNLYALDMSFGISNDDEAFYMIDAVGRAVFMLPSDYSDEDVESFMAEYGSKQAFTSLRIMLDGITAHFKHGPLRLPDLEIPIAGNNE